MKKLPHISHVLKILPLLLLTMILLPGPSLAGDDGRRNAAERRNDHRELRQDHRQLRDDLRDAGKTAALQRKYGQAAEQGDSRMLQSLHQQVARLLAAEAAHESAQARREVRRDGREVRSDRREIRRNRAEKVGGREAADDRRDLRDDRRDRRDDRRDAALEKERHQRYLALQARWNALNPSADLARHQEILAELTDLARAEVRSDRGEMREDRRELREDRRETREDRRES